MAIANPSRKTQTNFPRDLDTAEVARRRGVAKKSAAEPATGKSAVTIIRLSDPAMKKTMASTVRRLSTHPDEALRFLQDVGIATPTGRLAKRFGG